MQHAAKASSMWRQKHIPQLLPTQLGFGSSTNIPSTARAPRSAEATAQRHIYLWRAQMEWQRNAFSWETLPETIHRAWCTCLCILSTEIACGYFCKTSKARAALGWTVRACSSLCIQAGLVLLSWAAAG